MYSKHHSTRCCCQEAADDLLLAGNKKYKTFVNLLKARLAINAFSFFDDLPNGIKFHVLVKKITFVLQVVT